MLKAAIETILGISKPEIREIDGRQFVISYSGAKEVRPTIDAAEPLDLHSLDALVKLVKTEALAKYKAPVYLTIPTHEKVQCFLRPDSEKRENRQFLYFASAVDVPGWEGATTLKFEEAMIAIRTRFQETPDSQYALKLLSDITTGSKVTYNDNGIATSVVTKTGVALQSNEAIRPIVTLRPYRTFQEVEQPASPFLIRINERGINFVEADGGMWKLQARRTVKEYLDQAFEAEIESGVVVVAL